MLHAKPQRVLIAAENASLDMGGEAAIPYHLFRVLRERGVDAWLVVHQRCGAELRRRLPQECNRICAVQDTRIQKLAFRLGKDLPAPLAEATLGVLTQLITQAAQRKLLKKLATSGSVIHQPIPVSPRLPSLLFRLGSPVIIGPLNGGMHYPPAFCNKQSTFVDFSLRAARLLSAVANLLLPGKRLASTILVANARTRAALPPGLCGNVTQMPENGVDLTIWNATSGRHSPREPRFTFIGRLVDWKALDIALEALSRLPQLSLDVIGDGPMRQSWQHLAGSLGLSHRVRFHGWQPQGACAALLSRSSALLLPSLLECGGAVVLEAMATATPVIATRWGGPSDYLDSSCGILVPPHSREALVAGFTAAMHRLVTHPAEAAAMGAAGRARAAAAYDWERKADAFLEIYAAASATAQTTRPKWVRLPRPAASRV